MADVREFNAGPLHVSYDLPTKTFMVAVGDDVHTLEMGAARLFLNYLTGLDDHTCSKCLMKEQRAWVKPHVYTSFVAGIGGAASETVTAQLSLVGGLAPRLQDGGILRGFLGMVPEETRRVALASAITTGAPSMWGKKWVEKNNEGC